MRCEKDVREERMQEKEAREEVRIRKVRDEK